MYELIPMKKFDFGNLKENVRRKVLKLINGGIFRFRRNQATIYDRCNKNKYKRNIVKIMHNFDFL